jgi:hypothetical protein
MTNFNRIPLPLRAIPAWVVWKEELTDNGRPTKVPYNPVTFSAASSTDPNTWVTYDNAVAAYNSGGWDGIGFVLSENDPYTFIDLDDPYAVLPDGSPKHDNPGAIQAVQREVFDRFAGTYSEFSPSGKGLHIICVGASPGKGRRRHAVELYSTGRFMTMTGNVYTDAPIVERQAAVQWLYDEMGGAPTVGVDVAENFDREPDDVIIKKCLNAANGDKVRDLVNGNWQLHYTSQSEADFALIDIIAYYSRSRWQIMRLFRMSGLGQRDKAQRDNYVLSMIDRAFDRHPSPVDIDAVRNMLNDEFGEWQGGAGNVAVTTSPAPSQPVHQSPEGGSTGSTPAPSMPQPSDGSNPYLRPVPGLLGELAHYIYDQAPRPVPEIALAGAIGLMAGIAGRAFNVSGTGLNQYTLLLTGTGRGKEAIQSGISKLMSRVTDMNYGGCPAATEFVGPGDIASGQALGKHLANVSKSFLSVVGEVDVTMKNMTSKNANAALLKLRQMYLSAYSLSGRGNVLGSTIYSDRDKNTAAIASPAFSMIGEGTPERFYNLLDEAMVSDGLLPRFNVIEYDGRRVGLNEARANSQPPDWLVKKLAQFCGQALMLNQQGKPVDVELTADAQELVRAYDQKCDDVINAAHNDTIEQLWNRAHLKVLKLAATVAVGINPFNPVIDRNCAEWAISLIDHSTNRIVAKFAKGEIGEGMAKQTGDMRKAIKQMLNLTPERARKLNMSPDMCRDRLISHRGLQQAIANIASFKNAREGAPRAFQTTLQSLMDGGMIQIVPPSQLAQKYGVSAGRFYMVLSAVWLED